MAADRLNWLRGLSQRRWLSRPATSMVLAVAFGGAALLLAIWWAGGSWNEQRAARAAFPPHSGDLQLAGLSQSVEVLRDSRGIPHIEASVETDAWLTLGFVHAQDRLGQMLWLRRVARGEAAEAIGAAGLPSDRLMRSLGIGLYADRQEDALTPEVRRLLTAYAVGVNARIARVEAGQVGPPAGVALARGPIAPWTPGDSLALVKLVAWATGGGLARPVVLGDLLQHLGSVGARPFFPTGSGVQGVGVPFSMPRSVEAGSPASRRTRSRDTAFLDPQALASVAALRGSTSWIVAGRHTASGAPILVADMHLATTAPVLFYEAHLRGQSLDVAGATIPGVPAVWVGSNRHVAWAATSAHAVTVDLYREMLREVPQRISSPDGAGEKPPSESHWEFRDGEQWVPLARRVEIIRVREVGGVREVPHEVLETHHGPLVQDLVVPPLDGDAREPLAVAWTGARPGDGISALIEVARARNATELVAALASHHEPVLAVAYADREGVAGMQMAGWLPERRLGTGSVPVHGRQTAYDWRRALDFDRLPAWQLGEEGRSRRSGWLLVADNAFASTSRDVEWMWRSGERSERLDERLAALVGEGPVELKELTALQADLVVPAAADVIRNVLALVEDPEPLRPEVQEVVDLLLDWDGVATPGSAGAAAYHLLMDELIHALLGVPVGEELLERYVALPHVRPQAIVRTLLRRTLEFRDSSGWTDHGRARRVVRDSLRKTWFKLSYRLGPNRERWSWGRLHRLGFRGFGSSLRGEFSRLRIGPLPASGDGATLAVAAYRSGRDFDVETVAAYRVAIDLASPDRMLSSLAPGQSEHPNHPHFDDGLDRWLEGRSSLLVTNRLLVEEDSVELLVLNPAP